MKGAMRSYSFLVEVEAIQPDCVAVSSGSDQSLNSRIVASLPWDYFRLARHPGGGLRPQPDWASSIDTNHRNPTEQLPRQLKQSSQGTIPSALYAAAVAAKSFGWAPRRAFKRRFSRSIHRTSWIAIAGSTSSLTLFFPAGFGLKLRNFSYAS